ncbi:hypothetical protein BXT84_10595 [Sulfobacillus thermotolerans]|uniref:Peptidase C45 hydrolase domain-containing protein n=1 Tax=Sulfobacillus thermotolerans TaxID=338644 RepID=A0ABM6RSD2_9FIRM|nr:hypothetical protein BXT84_10595 [Sulfobacillus thermotolerans]
MCTTGILKGTDKEWLLGFKTLDAAPTGTWHAEVSFPSGMRALAVGITVQLGINSGLNSQGLCSVLSYLDTCMPDPNGGPQESGWVGDNRGLANASMLAECTTVQEGYQFLSKYFQQFPSNVGGNFLLADHHGTIGVVEYYQGQVRFQEGTENYLVRANNGVLLAQEEQKLLSPEIQFDRFGRYSLAETFGRTNHQQAKSDAIKAIKEFLSSHGDALNPPICVHDYDVPGARYSRSEPISTVTAAIFDMMNYRMLFTRSNPCSLSWEDMAPLEISV